MNNGNRLLQHPSAFSRGIYPSAWGCEMFGIPLNTESRLGINSQSARFISLAAGDGGFRWRCTHPTEIQSQGSKRNRNKGFRLAQSRSPTQIIRISKMFSSFSRCQDHKIIRRKHAEIHNYRKRGGIHIAGN